MVVDASSFDEDKFLCHLRDVHVTAWYQRFLVYFEPFTDPGKKMLFQIFDKVLIKSSVKHFVLQAFNYIC